MHHLPLAPSTVQVWPRMPDRWVFNKQTHLWERQQSKRCYLSCKWMACKQSPLWFKLSAVPPAVPTFVQFGTTELTQCYSGKGDLVKTNVYLPFSLHQNWHPALNSLPLPRHCGKATKRGPSLPISCCWPQKQKVHKQREQAENLGCVKYHWALKCYPLNLNFQEPQILQLSLLYIWGYYSLTINDSPIFCKPQVLGTSSLKTTIIYNCNLLKCTSHYFFSEN